MGTSGSTAPKADKASSPVQNQALSRPYQDWLPMQAYYGPGVAIPQYTGTALASGHSPHPYMWGAQHMMSPFVPPYHMVYPHGVHPQPLMALGSQVESQGISSSSTSTEAVMGSVPSNTDTSLKEAKSSKSPKKVKGTNGHAMPIDNGNAKNPVKSSSEDTKDDDEEGSSDRSHGNQKSDAKTREEGRNNASAMDVKTEATVDGSQVLASTLSSNKLEVTEAPSHKIDKPIGAFVSSASTPSFELWMPDDRSLKRERRKQSNRESARRSRLRKLAETEVLASKVQALASENALLRTEIGQLTENFDKLKLENAALLEKLKEVLSLYEPGGARGSRPMCTENLLMRIDDPSLFGGSGDGDGDGDGNGGGEDVNH